MKFSIIGLTPLPPVFESDIWWIVQGHFAAEESVSVSHPGHCQSVPEGEPGPGPGAARVPEGQIFYIYIYLYIIWILFDVLIFKKSPLLILFQFFLLWGRILSLCKFPGQGQDWGHEAVSRGPHQLLNEKFMLGLSSYSNNLIKNWSCFERPFFCWSDELSICLLFIQNNYFWWPQFVF